MNSIDGVCPECGRPLYYTEYAHDGMTLGRYWCAACHWHSKNLVD